MDGRENGKVRRVRQKEDNKGANNYCEVEDSIPSLDSEGTFRSHINLNILKCDLCGKMCKRAVSLPCCPTQTCNSCAVIEITKNRMCWECKNPVNCTKELIHEEVLREAIEWFRKNGTIKKEHGESLIIRGKLKTKNEQTPSSIGKIQRIAPYQISQIYTDALVPGKNYNQEILESDSAESLEAIRRSRSRSPEYIPTKTSSRNKWKDLETKIRASGKDKTRMRSKNGKIRGRSKSTERFRRRSKSPKSDSSISGSLKTNQSTRWDASKTEQNSISVFGRNGESSHNIMPKVHKKSQVIEPLPTASSSKGVVKLETKPYQKAQSKSLRQVVIDGSNVGMAHGGHEQFSVKGISICVKYFTKLGHKTVVMLPKHRWTRASTKEREVLDSLEQSKVLFYTPARSTPTNSWFCHDDRFLVEYATKNGGIVLTKDNYRDLSDEPKFKDTIENRLLTYMWVEDTLMIPNDPMGRDGPKLEQFLRK